MQRFFGLEREKAELLISVLLAMLLSSLDQTIVATAMPTIVEQLGGLSLFSWVFTAYMITSTIAIMLSGKIGDMKGRKQVYFYGVVLFIAGSVLSGLSENMLMLVIFRGLQGIGGGVMMVSSLATIGDIFPPAERGKWQGVIGAAFATSSVIGPAAGALITTTVGWRWVFYVNLPLGLLVLYLLYNAKHVRPAVHGHNIDASGAAWFTVFIFSFIVYTVSYLGSLEVPALVLLFLSIASLALFIREEMRAPEPVLPLGLFSSRTFSISVMAAFVTAIAMYGAVMFLPFLVEVVQGRATVDAGIALTPLTLAIVLSSMVSGQVIARTGKYKLVGIIGCVLVSAGLYLFMTLHGGSDYAAVLEAAALLGFGVGATMPLFIVVSQNAFEHSVMGTVTSTISFFRSLGGVIGVAIMGAMLNVSGASTAADSGVLLNGLHNAFGIALLLSAIPVCLMLLLKEAPLRKTHGKAPIAEEVGIELAEESIMDGERGRLG